MRLMYAQGPFGVVDWKSNATEKSVSEKMVKQRKELVIYAARSRSG